MTSVSASLMVIIILVGLSGATKPETSTSTNSSDIRVSSLRGTTNVGQNGGRSTSASAMHNMAGCPKLSTNCNFDCLSIGSNGCIICTCTNEGSSISLTSSITGSQSGQGSHMGGVNGSSPLTNMQSPFSINTGSTGTGSSGSSGANAQISQNSNGCPAFPNNCHASCASLDSNGCPICACAKNSTTTSSSNNNGCPPFPANCRSDCVSLNSFRCPLCSCTSGSGTGPISTSKNTSSVSAFGKQSPSKASSNNNGCPPFPTNCRTDCVELTSLGCPVCKCTTSGSGVSGTGSSSSASANNGYTHASQGSMSNNNGCPKFSSSCPAECTTTSDYGCPICTCSAFNHQSSSSGTTAPSSASGGSHVECPPLMPNCNIACLRVEEKGCIICDGNCNENYKKEGNATGLVATTTKSPVSTSKSTSGESSGSGSGVNCAPFDRSCSASCASFDLHGCLVCTCADHNGGNSGASSGNMNGCLPFDTSCPDGCADVDKNGCLICTCSGNSTGGSASSNGTSGGSGNTGTIKCSAFDGAHCNPTCIGVDSNGCLSCNCKIDVTTSSNIVSTTKSQGITGGQTDSGTGTQTGGTGTGNTNSCAAYDTNCPPGCTKLDAFGCLFCSCSLQNGTNSMTSGSTGNGNNCPAFDTKCITDCTHIDSRGCLTCSCTGNTTAPGAGTGHHLTNGNANNCPAVDIMSCKPTCLKLDRNGCVSCTCQATTPKTMAPVSSATTSSSPTTATEHPLSTRLQTKKTTTIPTQNCPKFDESCTRDCIIIDKRGCLGCTCSAPMTTQSSMTSKSTTQIPSTFPVTTKSSTTQRPHIAPVTTEAPQQTTPAMCPPIRCVYPCNAGVTLGADNCPVCKCRTNVTSSTV